MPFETFFWSGLKVKVAGSNKSHNGHVFSLSEP